MDTNMDSDVKLQTYYDADLMRKYVTYFEINAELMNDKSLSPEKHAVVAQLCAHYRRMIVCMAMKQIPEGFMTNDVLHLKEMFQLLSDEKIV